MADGSITFDTKIDTTGVSDGIKELKKEIADLQRGYDSAAKEYGQLQKKLEETPNDSGLKKQAAILEKYLNDAGPKLEDMKERLENMKPLEGPAKDADKLAAKLTGIYDSMQKMMELGTDPTSKAFQSKKYDADETAKELDRVYAEMNSMSPDIATDLQTHLASLQKANQEAMSQFTSSFTMDQDQKNLQAEIMKTADDLDALAAKQQEYQKQGIDPQTDKWKKNQSNIDESKKKLDELLAKLRETNAEAANGLQSIADSEYKNLKGQASKYASGVNSTTNLPDISGKLAKANASFKVGLKNLLKYSLGIRSLFFLFRKLRTAMSEGLKNLVQFHGGVNKTNTAMTGITSSLMYMKNAWAAAFAPVLSAVEPILTTLIDMLSSAANALARFFAILGNQSTYIKATKVQQNYAKSLAGTGAAAKKLASFDEINQLNMQNSGGVSPNQMFEEASTGGASEFALQTAEKLQAIWGDLVSTAQALGAAWNEAWSYNDNGLRITTALQGMWFDLLDNIKQITQATEEWAASLTFVPLVTAIADVLESLRPVLNDIEQAGVWIYQKAVLPIATWLIESGLPAILEVIAGLLDVIDATLQAMAPVAQAIYDNVIAPVASTIGEAIVKVLQAIAEGLKAVADWISQHEELTQALITVVLSLIAAWNIVKVALEILGGSFGIFTGIITVLKDAMLGVQTVFTVLTSPIGLVVLAIAALIAILVLLITHWDKVKVVAQTVCNAVKAAWVAMVNGLKSLWESFSGFIGAGINAVKSFFQGLIDFITSTFTAAWEKAWEGVKDIFRGVWNGIASICENVVNGIVDALNKLAFDVPDWVPLAGGKHFGFSLDHVSIPRLATGTVIPPAAGEFAAILGDNRTDTEVVSPLETMKEAMLEALQESGSGQKQIVLKFDGNLAELARILKPELEQEDRRAGVQLVVEG
jgi:phage-related protein